MNPIICSMKICLDNRAQSLPVWCAVVLCVLMTSHQVSSQCTVTNKNGVVEDLPNATYEIQTFSSPGWKVAYFPVMDCRWRFSAPSATDKLVIDVREYYIEGSPGCRYDYMEFYDDYGMSAEPNRFCNVARTGTMLVTTGQYGYLQLKSDFSVQYAGFTLRYLLGTPQLGAADCSTTISLTATGSKQYFTSRYWPDQRDDTEECIWQITPTTSNYGIEIEVIYSDLQAGEECFSDLLEIHDTNVTGTRLGLVCDDRRYFPSQPMTFVSTTTSAAVKYTSMRSGYYRRGFVIAYSELYIGINASTTTQATTTSQVVVSTCSSATVSLTASATPQYITTPSYPIFYQPNQDCKWLINAPVGNIINLRVIDSSLEDSEGCMGDKVIIYDGAGTNYPALTSFCGALSYDVNSTSNEMLVRFTSDGSYQERGFRFEYMTADHTTPSCVDTASSDEWTNLTATTTPEYFTSPNYPNNYNSSISYHWLIRNPSDTGVIKLEVVDSRLEANPSCVYDSVTVYKGPCSTYPVLGKFCSTDTPTYTQNTGSYVLVVMTTDSNTEFKGFRIKYYVTQEEEDDSSVWNTVGLIVGVVVGVVVLGGIIGGLIYAAKAGKLPGFDAKYKKHRRGSVSSLSSASSSEGESPRPGTSEGRLKHQQLPPLGKGISSLPPLDSFGRKMNILPSIKK